MNARTNAEVLAEQQKPRAHFITTWMVATSMPESSTQREPALNILGGGATLSLTGRLQLEALKRAVEAALENSHA